MADNIVFENHIMRYINNSKEDGAFIKTLFNDEKVRKYFVLSDAHAQNIELFTKELAERNNTHQGANLIIETNDYTPVGIITTHIDRTYFGEFILRASCAILPEYRGQDYAKMALKGLIFLLQPSEFKRLFLLISENNIPSQMVAQSCGFKRDRYFSTVDHDHPEVGWLFNWVKNIHFETPRDIIGHKGGIAQRAKDYQKAISFYEQALNEECDETCIYTDAMIYSNMGIALSNMKQYLYANKYLRKAWELGCHNSTLKKEITWLKDHVEIIKIQIQNINYGCLDSEKTLCLFFSGLDGSLVSLTPSRMETLVDDKYYCSQLHFYEEDLISETKVGLLPNGDEFKIIRANKKGAPLVDDDTISFTSMYRDGYAVNFKIIK